MRAGFFSPKASADPGGQTPLRPSPPLAKRLNRNALTVAAIIMGMTVLTAIVVLNPGRGEKKAAAGRAGADEAPPVPSRPAFLDEPVRAPAGATIEQSGGAAGELALRAAAGWPNAERPTSGEVVRSSSTVGGDALSGDVDPYAPSTVPQSGPSLAAPSGREQAYQAALTSSAVAGAPQARPGDAGQAAAGSLASEEEQLVALGDSILRASVRQPAGGTAAEGRPVAAANAAVPASQENRHRAFLERAGDAGGSAVVAQLEPAGSPYTLRAGTVIPGALITGINSDLPGEIVAQVSRNVYDSRSQRVLLIPKGSRLIGSYDNQVAAGQGRLLVAWTRLILPDGRSMRLPGLALTDPQGQTGAKDRVDKHWRRVFGNALLLSAIGAGVQLSQPRQASILAAPSAGQVAAGALGQELSNVALEIIRRGMSVAPTITIRAGQPFNVFLNGDLVFDGPYEEAPAGAR